MSQENFFEFLIKTFPAVKKIYSRQEIYLLKKRKNLPHLATFRRMVQKNLIPKETIAETCKKWLLSKI